MYLFSLTLENAFAKIQKFSPISKCFGKKMYFGSLAAPNGSIRSAKRSEWRRQTGRFAAPNVWNEKKIVTRLLKIFTTFCKVLKIFFQNLSFSHSFVHSSVRLKLKRGIASRQRLGIHNTTNLLTLKQNLFQSTIDERHVEQHHVLAVLVAVEDVVHVGQILLDSLVNHPVALVVAILCSEHHL